MATITETSINLFLRTIKVDPVLITQNLKNDLSKYIDKKFKELGCCVFWFKHFETNSDISKILRRHHISPKHDDNFSIIIRDKSILFSSGGEKAPKVFFTASESYWETRKDEQKARAKQYNWY